MQLYRYQEKSVEALRGKRHLLIAGTGLGKGYISLAWAKQTGKQNVVVVTQASKRDSHDFENEGAELDSVWYNSLSSFVVLSWNGLAKWFKEHSDKLAWEDFAFIFDECHRAKAGVSSGMGRAFLSIARRTEVWTGYTATPGDKWIDFYGYFIATRFIRNKGQFISGFCNMQTYKGYPEIVSYHSENILQEWWKEITYFPDTASVEAQLPSATHKVVEFKKPKGYDSVMKTRERLDTHAFIDTTMGLCHYLRQLCNSKQKLEWLSDFVEGLGERCVIFYNYTEEGELIEKTIKKVMPKGAKVWNINGKTHDIPTAETMGARDVVLAQWTSGSASLNLQFINYWVSASPCYSLTVSVQGRGRIRRIGQTKPQFFYYLKCSNTIEEDIYACLKEKRDFSEKTWYEQKFEKYAIIKNKGEHIST